MAERSRSEEKIICMVTGSTSGIGAATCLALARQGASVVLVGRNEKKCERQVKKIEKITGVSSVEYMLADLSSLRDVYDLAERYERSHDRLDVLINNAGAKFVSHSLTGNGMERTFALNHLSHFLLTNLLFEMLKRARKARVINVSSGAHGGCRGIDFDDLFLEKEYTGKKAYAQSKLANILFTYELARRLEGTGMTANALHPGGVATNFCRNNGMISWLKHLTAHGLKRELISPARGAETSIYLATSPEVESVSGKYFSNRKEASSSAASHDEKAARRLWDVSLELVGLSKSLI